MPRIIVTTDPFLPREPREDASVLLDEHVHSVHLSTGHAAAQLIERLAWAITDAEAAEGTRPAEHANPLGPSLRSARDIRPGAHLPIAV
jgi:hypothetical protein